MATSQQEQPAPKRYKATTTTTNNNNKDEELFDRKTLLNTQWLRNEALLSRNLYANLCDFCDRYGHRLSGSSELEDAIDYLVSGMKLSKKFDRVYKEAVRVPHWIRNRESLHITAPITKKIAMLGIGNSIGTPEEGINTNRIIVCHSFDEMYEKSALIKNSVVLFNVPFTTYHECSPYRVNSASKAASLGALAVLVRSICPESLDTPHTGTLVYDENAPKIPGACITIEAADMLERLILNHGNMVNICLKMNCLTMPDEAISHNIIAEIRGSELPDEIVAFGGHIDGWDVGQGAHDDAQACILGIELLNIIAMLNIRPKRTLRLVCWTNEENGQRGAREYFKQHKHEFHQVVLETDLGVSNAIGFGFSGSLNARVIMNRVLSYVSRIHNGKEFILKGDGRGVDIRPMIDDGVPGLLLRLNDEWWQHAYFRLHHTAADTVDKINPTHYRENLSLIMCTLYLLSELSIKLPRT